MYVHQNDISRMEHKLSQNQDLFDKRLGPFQDLEKSFAERTESYDSMKKDIVGNYILTENDIMLCINNNIDYFMTYIVFLYKSFLF